MLGADPDELDRLAQAFGAAARQVDTLTRHVSARLGHAPWHGLGADRFRSDWNRVHRAHLGDASAFLREGERELHRNATDQRDVSRGDGGRLGGGSGSSGLPADVAAIVAAFIAALGPQWTASLSSPPTAEQIAMIMQGANELLRFLQDPKLSGDVSGQVGAFGSVDTTGAATLFGVALQGQAGASFRAGAEGHAGFTLTPSQLSVLAGASVGIAASAYAQGSASWGLLSASGRAEVTAQARAYAKAKATLNRDGLSASAEAGAIAGVSASAEGSVDVGGVGVGGSASAYAGIGAVGKAELDVTMDKIDATVKLGAALGVGVSFQVHVAVEPVKIAQELSDGAAGAAHFLDSLF
jgi:uncharacterized protein YukE